VDLFAVFVCDDGACGGSCVCAEDDAVLEFDAYDRSPCRGVPRLLESIACQGEVSMNEQMLMQIVDTFGSCRT
jgi:hypothetical protein